MLGLDLVIVGSAGVGKTSLIKRFVSEINSENYSVFNQKATLGIDMFNAEFKVDEKDIKLTIWDTAGQEKYFALASGYYKKADIILLVFDISIRATFEKARDYWVETVTENAKSEAVIIVLGNKSDLPNKEANLDEYQSMASKHGFLCFETTATKGESIKQAIFEACRECFKRLETIVDSSIRIGDLELEVSQAKEEESSCCN